VYPATPQQIAPVLEEVELLQRLIDDLRMLSLAEAGQLPLQREVVAVADLLDDLHRSFAQQAQRVGIDLRVVGAPPVAVHVDPQRMQQVLGNLVSNSLRHTPAGGTIELRAERDGTDVAIAVRDTGSGISPDDLPHLFDRFWRGDRSRSREGHRTGLGLAIARQLTEAHGGAMKAASQPGDGTTITVRLPIAQAVMNVTY
jgi:signal transduction histidine kinase